MERLCLLLRFVILAAACVGSVCSVGDMVPCSGKALLHAYYMERYDHLPQMI